MSSVFQFILSWPITNEPLDYFSSSLNGSHFSWPFNLTSNGTGFEGLWTWFKGFGPWLEGFGPWLERFGPWFDLTLFNPGIEGFRIGGGLDETLGRVNLGCDVISSDVIRTEICSWEGQAMMSLVKLVLSN